MSKITFKGKIRDIGNSNVVTIPMQYIKDGLLWTGDEFEITVDNLDDKPAGDL